jgi:hypothetical protein
VQGVSKGEPELVDAAALVGHLVPAGSVFAFLAEHRRGGLPLTYGGFDPPTLVYWRKRLAASARPHRINDAIDARRSGIGRCRYAALSCHSSASKTIKS